MKSWKVCSQGRQRRTVITDAKKYAIQSLINEYEWCEGLYEFLAKELETKELSDEKVEEYKEAQRIALEKMSKLEPQIKSGQRELRNSDKAYNKDHFAEKAQQAAQRRWDRQTALSAETSKLEDGKAALAQDDLIEATQKSPARKIPLWLRKDKDRDRGR